MSEESVVTVDSVAPPATRYELPEALPAASDPAQDTADSASVPEKPDGEIKQAEPAPTEEPKPGQSRFDRKLARAYRERAEAQGRAAFLEQQVESMRPKEVAPTPGAPRLEDFSDINEYARAVSANDQKNLRAQWEQGQQQQSAQAAQQHLTQGWEAKVTRAEAKYEDFDEVVGDLKPTTAWAIALMQAENGDDIAYHLGLNGAAEGRKIAALDPLSQVREIGKLEAKFAATTATPKSASRAPAPIKTVSGTNASTDDGPNESQSMKEWIRARNKELGRR